MGLPGQRALASLGGVGIPNFSGNKNDGTENRRHEMQNLVIQTLNPPFEYLQKNKKKGFVILKSRKTQKLIQEDIITSDTGQSINKKKVEVRKVFLFAVCHIPLHVKIFLSEFCGATVNRSILFFPWMKRNIPSSLQLFFLLFLFFFDRYKIPCNKSIIQNCQLKKKSFGGKQWEGNYFIVYKTR